MAAEYVDGIVSLRYIVYILGLYGSHDLLRYET
jgi:hypothetical protein